MLSKFADYSGATAANVDKLTFRVYQDPAAAYADAVAGSLDYIDESNIPQDQLVGDAFQGDFPERWSQRESGRISWIWFSSSDPQLKDKPELRKAISEPSTAISSPSRSGPTRSRRPPAGSHRWWTATRPTSVANPASSTRLRPRRPSTAAGGYKGTLTMTYNADSPNKAWSEAVCNSIKNTLGIECVAVPTVDFATFQRKIDANELKGIFRASWQMDYPSIENFLVPLYAKGAWPPGSNWGRYENPKFDELNGKAAAATNAGRGQ